MKKREAKFAIVEVAPTPKAPSLDDPFFVFKKGSNVQQTWRKHGWTPPTEYRNDYDFKKNRDEGIAK